MPRVEITLNGRSHAVACEPGEETRLRNLVAYVDASMRQMAKVAPGGTEAQILVLTALRMADKYFDLKDEYDTLAARPPVTVSGPPAPDPALPREQEDMMVAAVDHLARRIEDIAARLEGA